MSILPSARKNGAVPASFTLRKTPMKFEDAPRLPKLPFIAIDIALLALAASIAALHPNPAAPIPLFIITGCFVAGIAVTMIPYLVNYDRDCKDAATAERHELGEQLKQLAAASDHLQNSTIQLKSVEEAVTKNMEAADRLPFRLQERIAEFNQQLAAAENKDKARLEQELARLRTGESERQAAAAARITTALGEWTRVEADARQNFTAMVQQAKESFERALAEWTRIEADARQSLAAMVKQEKELIEQQAVATRIADRENQTAAVAQIAIALAEFAKLEADARRSFTDTVQREKELFGQQVAKLRSTENERLAAAAEEITMTLATWTGIEAGIRRQLTAAAELQGKLADTLSALDGRIAVIQATAKVPEGASPASPPSAETPPPPAPAEGLPVVSGSEPVEATAAEPAPVVVEAAPSPEPSVPSGGMAAGLEPSEEAKPQPATTPEPATPAGCQPAIPEALPAVVPIPAVPETIPPPVPPEPPAATGAAADLTEAGAPPPVSAPEVAPPPAPSDVTPAPEPSVADSTGADLEESEPPGPAPGVPDPAAESKPRKPRALRKPKSESTEPTDAAAESVPESPVTRPPPAELIAEPVADEAQAPESFSQVPPEEEKPVATPSADGRTRLTVISYIGIGNKLHLRGEGAGLSWTKGVPLQFLSIGRWRWETGDVSRPVLCRIYKNDKLEAPVGLITLPPGTEQEVSASF